VNGGGLCMCLCNCLVPHVCVDRKIGLVWSGVSEFPSPMLFLSILITQGACP